MQEIIDFENYETIPKDVVDYTMQNKQDYIRGGMNSPNDKYIMILTLTKEKLMNIISIMMTNLKTREFSWGIIPG